MMKRSRPMQLAKEHILRVLFPPAAAWLVLNLFAQELDRLQGLNPFPERAVAHAPVEAALFWAPLLFALAAGVWTVRRWPAFLRLPPAASLPVVVFRLVVHGMIWAVAAVIGALALFALSYDRAADPQGQYWIWAGAAALWHAVAVAPFAALVTVWRSLRRKNGRVE